MTLKNTIIFESGNYLKSRIFDSISNMTSNEEKQFLRVLLHQPIMNVHLIGLKIIQMPTFKDGVITFITISPKYILDDLDNTNVLSFMTSVNSIYYSLSVNLFSWLSNVILDYDAQNNNPN